MKMFPEEQEQLDKLLREWYQTIKDFTEWADDIFSERGKQYDRTEPAWEALNFPHGFAHEIRKKIGRVQQCLVTYQGRPLQGTPTLVPPSDRGVDWDTVVEELRDIANYSRMFGALVIMLQKRTDGPQPTQPTRHTAQDVLEATVMAFTTTPPVQTEPPPLCDCSECVRDSLPAPDCPKCGGPRDWPPGHVHGPAPCPKCDKVEEAAHEDPSDRPCHCPDELPPVPF